MTTAPNKERLTDEYTEWLKKAYPYDHIIIFHDIQGELHRYLLISAIITYVEITKKLIEYTQHKQSCIRNKFEAGGPRLDGSYWNKFAGVWYQASPVNNEPKCDCGLDEAYEAYQKATGK